MEVVGPAGDVLLHQREPEALRDPAMDLALDERRVDGPADVVGGDDPADLTVPSSGRRRRRRSAPRRRTSRTGRPGRRRPGASCPGRTAACRPGRTGLRPDRHARAAGEFDRIEPAGSIDDAQRVHGSSSIVASPPTSASSRIWRRRSSPASRAAFPRRRSGATRRTCPRRRFDPCRRSRARRRRPARQARPPRSGSGPSRPWPMSRAPQNRRHAAVARDAHLDRRRVRRARCCRCRTTWPRCRRHA